MYYNYLDMNEPAVLERECEIIRCQQENTTPIPPKLKAHILLHTYRDIFNGEFNLGFALPRTDTCTTCDKLALIVRSSKGAEKEKLEKELEEHHKLAESAFTMRKDDKARAVRSWVGKPRRVCSSGVNHCSKDALDMITYDFQQNLETPNLQHNDTFYKRQLWTYNFGIHDCVSNQGYMFMWDETTAKRGSVEVANCLYDFLTEFNTGAR
ncbi:uncharacterized protein LOC113669687 [Pocillopora damicornis]|nr:uncharacterized protein LOC113669687 [Pocillopora damicornis]